MITCVVIQFVVIVCLTVLCFRYALHSDADIQNARIEIQERDNKIYKLKDDLAKVRHEHVELIVVFKARNEAHASEIQNLHSVYQRKLDEADEQLRIESRSLASELEEAQDQRDVARAELGVAEEKIIEYCNTIAELRGEKAGYDKQLFEKEREIQKLKDDVSILDRRLQDYDERIRLAISARLVAESQLDSIREVCCGK